MDATTYKHLQDWLNLIKNQQTQKDTWTHIPNVGYFKNLKFIPQPSELDNEINITLQYDEWKESDAGKFIRKIKDMAIENFGLDYYLVDDPKHEYYSEHPQLIIYPFGEEEQTTNIMIEEDTIDGGVWVNYKHKTFKCKQNIEEVFYCIYSAINEFRNKDFDKIPHMPCETNLKNMGTL